MVKGWGLSEIDVISLYPPQCEVKRNRCSWRSESRNFLWIIRIKVLNESRIKQEGEAELWKWNMSFTFFIRERKWLMNFRYVTKSVTVRRLSSARVEITCNLSMTKLISEDVMGGWTCINCDEVCFVCVCICVSVCVCTSCYSQHSHDPDDGGVDWEGRVDLNLLQGDAHHW